MRRERPFVKVTDRGETMNDWKADVQSFYGTIQPHIRSRGVEQVESEGVASLMTHMLFCNLVSSPVAGATTTDIKYMDRIFDPLTNTYYRVEAEQILGGGLADHYEIPLINITTSGGPADA